MRRLAKTALLLTLAFIVSACLKGSPEKNNFCFKYQIVIVEPVAITADLKTYAGAARLCQKNALDQLEKARLFKFVSHTAPEEPGAAVLLVKARITDIRLAKTADEKSYINVQAKLVEAASGLVLHEKQLSTQGADGVRPSAQAEDLPLTMGAILADYVLRTAPAL